MHPRVTLNLSVGGTVSVKLTISDASSEGFKRRTFAEEQIEVSRLPCVTAISQVWFDYTEKLLAFIRH